MSVLSGLFLATGLTVVLLLTACGEGDSPSLFASRVEASFDVTAKVTYEVTFAPAGTGNPAPTTTTITQGRWGRRMDGYSTREKTTFSGSFLDAGDKQYVCSRVTGFLNPEGLREGALEALKQGICFVNETSLFDYEGLGGLFDLTLSFKQTLKEHDEEVQWEARPSRTIAGINADCYQATFTDTETGTQEDTDICLSSDDILLLMDMRSPDVSATMLASEVDRDVQESDFVLPYAVVDWPP